MPDSRQSCYHDPLLRSTEKEIRMMIRSLWLDFTLKSVFWRFSAPLSYCWLLKSCLLKNLRQYDFLDSVEQIFHQVCVRCCGLIRVDLTPLIFVLVQEPISDKGSRYFMLKEPCNFQDLFEDDVLDGSKHTFH